MNLHIAAGVHGAIHSRIGLRVHHAQRYGCANISSIHNAHGELPRRKRRHIGIPSADDRRVLANMRRRLAGEFRVGEIELRLIL